MGPEVSSYGPHRRQQVYTEQIDPQNDHWFVIIHGGAWRDEKITYKQSLHLLNKVRSVLPNRFGGLAALDYRLSPGVLDPEHVRDCANALAFLSEKFGVKQVTVLGHSCGAFMGGQLATDHATLNQHMPSIASLIGVEGIYDLHALTKQYPEYHDFVDLAFGADSTKWPTIPWNELPLKAIVQSLKDEYLDLRQSLDVQQLTEARMVILERGKHDEVFEQEVDWFESIYY